MLCLVVHHIVGQRPPFHCFRSIDCVCQSVIGKCQARLSILSGVSHTIVSFLYLIIFVRLIHFFLKTSSKKLTCRGSDSLLSVTLTNLARKRSIAGQVHANVKIWAHYSHYVLDHILSTWIDFQWATYWYCERCLSVCNAVRMDGQTRLMFIYREKTHFILTK